MIDTNVEKYISILPAERQKLFQEMGFNAFIHYGMNTFTDKEWGDGQAQASLFNPTNQDTDQWMEALKEAGVKGVIITAKHHDGFCLWQTKTTDYSVKNSPYKNGEGDVVREVSDSCKKYGIKFGVYLSPWDRNSEYYATEKYNDFYIEQLKELLTQYGDVFCVWLDGACGSHMDGKPKQVYDFNRIYDTVREYQPNACVSGCGPDIRWVGNEAGYARKSEWNVVPAFSFDTQKIEGDSQQADTAKFSKKGFDVVSSDLGSREVLKNFNEFIWYPAEVDVSIRPGWFYHEKEDKKVRSLMNLLRIYYNSVGGNSLLLLNVPPTQEGRIHDNDVKRLQEFGQSIRDGVAFPVNPVSIRATGGSQMNFPVNCITDDESYFTPIDEAEKYAIELDFAEPTIVDKVCLKEQCDFSQRIEEYVITAFNGEKDKVVYEGTTVGFSRFALFNPVTADKIRIEITKCRSKPCIKFICAYGANGKLPKDPFYKPLILAAHAINYKVYVEMQKWGGKMKKDDGTTVE